MKKSKIFLVVLIALLMAVGIVLISCGGACGHACEGDDSDWWLDCCPDPVRTKGSYIYGCRPCNC